MSGEPIRNRKADHIQICLDEDIAQGHCYWDDVRLIHKALPEIDLDDVNISAEVLGKKLSFPFMVTAITGGFPGAKRINSNIAEACAEIGVGMGVGSERAGVSGVDPDTYEVVREFDVPLVVGNVGAPQLISQKSKDIIGADEVGKAMDLVRADYMAIHLNYLQEVIQPEGDSNSKGVLDAIRGLTSRYPIIVKETGAGIDPASAEMLADAGVRALDVEGMGGTSFSAVEMYRASEQGDERLEQLGDTFFDWGIPAPVALAGAHTAGIPLIASGGILNGIHVAASIAMGAQAAGAAHLFLREATESADAVKRKLEIIRDEFRTAMMLTGCGDVGQLACARYAVLGKTREWMEALK